MGITGEEIPQPFGERQHPLPHRDLWKDLINQVGCRLLHPPGIAGGADSASFTREGDEKIVSTAGTSCSGKAMRQDTILEIFAEILLDVSGNRGTFLICLTTNGQPGFKMTLNDLISRATLCLPTPKPQCLGRFPAQLGYRSPQP